MEVIVRYWNAVSAMLSHPSPSSTSSGEPASIHMYLVKILSAGDVPGVYVKSTISI